MAAEITEKFWSLEDVVRGAVGTFHKISKKYAPVDVAEFQFRYSNPTNEDIFGETIKS
jgi:hypothetical protein